MWQIGGCTVFNCFVNDFFFQSFFSLFDLEDFNSPSKVNMARIPMQAELKPNVSCRNIFCFMRYFSSNNDFHIMYKNNRNYLQSLKRYLLKIFLNKAIYHIRSQIGIKWEEWSNFVFLAANFAKFSMSLRQYIWWSTGEHRKLGLNRLKAEQRPIQRRGREFLIRLY